MTFLIDTGSDISLCKENIIQKYDIINEDKCKLKGITKDYTETLGSTELELVVEEQNIKHKFYIVDSGFQIKTDGILGMDFFLKYKCLIDYETHTMSVYINENNVTIPIEINMKQIHNIIIPPRSEKIVRINININEDSVICNKEIENGIFVANTIIPKYGNRYVKILNSTEQPVRLSNLKISLIPLKHYNIFKTCHKEKTKYSEQRFQKLLKIINFKDLDKDNKQIIYDILRQYQGIFHLEGEPLTTNNFYTQNIELKDKTPVYIKNYRLPQTQSTEIDRQVQGLLKENIIEPSVSPYNSPLLLVPKKGQDDIKKWRLVVDYRRLNDKIVNDKFPLTRLEDILDKLGRAKYFSTLDMTSSFHQIELDTESRPLTAFSTNSGHYQYNRLPFGLKISSNSFQRMLTLALTGLESEAFLYVDDIIVFGCNLKHHNENLIKVFKRLEQYNLKLNAEKCCFLKPEVLYLGHLITKNGVKTDPSKYKIIEQYPIPKNADDVRRFIAFCNYYRRFIPDFAKTANCLNNLLRKKVKFDWTEDCQKAFDELRNKLKTPPILQYPDFDKPFVLTTDASNVALGAILSQGEIGNDLPISYASKSLNKHERNKSVIEKELLGIHWGIQFFRPYLYGRKFTVVTDHRPLIALFSHKNPSSKLTRIRLELSDYDFDIVYKKGANNTNADALSRIEINSEILKNMIPSYTDEKEKKTLAITRGMTNQNELNKKNEVKKKNKLNNEKNGISQKETDHLHMWECTSINNIKGTQKIEFIYDNKLQQELKKELKNKNDKVTRIICNKSENPMFSGTFMEKLLLKLKKLKFKKYVLYDDDEIFKYITAEKLKEEYNKMKNKNIEIIIYKMPKRINESIKQYRLIEEFHNTPHSGHFGIRKTLAKLKQRYIWKNMNRMVKNYVTTCKSCQKNKQYRHTKEPFKITDTPTSSFDIVVVDTVGPLRPSNNFRYILTIQCELTKYVVAHAIESKDAKTVAKTLVEQIILKYGLFKVLRTDRGTEFTNELMKEICELLKINQKFSTPYHHETLGTVERNHRVLNEYLLNFVEDENWHEWIPYFSFAFNTTPNIDTEYSPFELVFGKLPRLPSDELQEPQRIYNLDNYINELKTRLRYSLRKARELILKVKTKRQLDSKAKQNKIDIKTGDLVLVKVGNKRKHEKPYKGPYKVVDIDEFNVIIETEDSKLKTIHKNMLKKYFD